MSDDHVKNQLCARIEELEKEKLELNEQLDIAQQHCDAFSAHVERLHMAWVDAKRCVSVVAFPALYRVEQYQHLAKRSIEKLESVVSDTPTTSLARLKALWMAEGVQRAADSIRYDYEGHVHQDRIADHVDDVASELYRQAKGSET